MAFGSTANKPANNKGNEPKESAFLKLDPAKETIIRILSKQEVSYWFYWYPVNINGTRTNRSVVVDFDNPIKRYMDSIGPDAKGFMKPSRKFRINVLDRSIGDTGPVNKVKMFDIGITTLNSLVALDGKARKRNDFSKRLGITEFDMLLNVSLDAKGNKVINPLQYLDDDPLPEALRALPMYDLDRICAPLPYEAVERIMNGDDYLKVLEDIGRSGDYPMIPQE